MIIELYQRGVNMKTTKELFDEMANNVSFSETDYDLLKEKPKVLFTELFEENNTPYIVVTFLSVLEMTKENDIIIRQDSNFKDITIELKVK